MVKAKRGRQAPPLKILAWINRDQALSLADLQGQVILLLAFQISCPACQRYAMPQTKRAQAYFNRPDFKILGVHTAFENHKSASIENITSYLHTEKITYPVAIDHPSDDPHDPLPLTMRDYQMQGTPTFCLIDRLGFMRRQHFGHMPDLQLGAEIMALLSE